ncbi:Dopey, N-terminal-domain-containing protein [Phakopsora pachyrhizi]|nr:Dopey, N-terminal-domain-containing protein [Phakopsora pachyrhizi]
MTPDRPVSSSSKLSIGNRPTGSAAPGLHSTSSIASLRASTQQTHASPPIASVDRTSAFAEAGEVQSGRALSVGRRARDDWIVSSQEKALASDPKYRKYSSLVERTLLSIDQVNEWADFITFLAKLLKTLQSHPQYPIIPHKLTVAKRLSQCLNPALPQGVHQRALDVYGYILTTIGSDGLRRDLQVWSTGLFPFFQYAATTVRPIVLGLFETFYLPLKAELRPAMKAFILALLPGLEEETGEHFERVCSLLDELSGAVSLSFFLQNLWLVLITCPGYRISAINFLNRRMPRLSPEISITSVVGEDVGLMVRGYASALEDSNILVQRGILDLLLSNLRIDSLGFRSDTRRFDQLLLTRAALGVVLRRDLSLSRRLYTWLLEPVTTDDTVNGSKSYFREYGLSLVAESLREDMRADYLNALVERQRPFKIFIALLDKWEIGGPLTETLALDAFRALKDVLEPNDPQDELLLTANMMFDALDPFITWKGLFDCVNGFMMQKVGGEESLELLKFIVTNFKMGDEELLQIHIPLFAFALIDMVDQFTLVDPDSQSSQIQALKVATVLMQELSEQVIGSEPSITLSSQSNYDLASQLYQLENSKPLEAQYILQLRSPVVYAKALSSALRVTQRITQAPLQKSSDFLNVSLEVLETLLNSVRRACCKVIVDWNPFLWMELLLSVLKDFPLNALGFNLLERTIRVSLGLSDAAVIDPPMILDNRDVLAGLIAKLLEFLQGRAAPFFLEAVKLFWYLQKATKLRHVETILASLLSSRNPSCREAAFESFGNLWKYTEDSLLPGTQLRMPMLLVLDSLKSDDLSLRRCGELWMRCSLKSYLRILDPLFRVLLNPQIRRKPFELQLSDRSLQVYYYVHPFNQEIVQYTLESILTLIRFGGQGFTRITKTCFLKHSHDPALRRMLNAADLESASYLDALIQILLLFINSSPEPILLPAMSFQNESIHSTTADLLQTIVSRGDLTPADLMNIEKVLTHRLLISVRSLEYNLQNKLLHALHSTISAETTSPHHSRNSTSQEALTNKAKTDLSPAADSTLLALIIGDGIVTQNYTAIVHHWIDFLLMTVPQFRRSLNEVVNPLIDRLIAKLSSLVGNIEETYRVSHSGADFESEFSDSEFSAFVNALERLIIVLIEDGGSSASFEEEHGNKNAPERSALSDSTTGLFSGVFNVLGSTESTAHYPQNRPKSKFQSRLGNAIRVLMRAWDISVQMNDVNVSDSTNSKTYFSSRMKLRTKKAFERIYKTVSGEVVEAIVDFWQEEIASRPTVAGSEDNMFLLLDHLAPSAQTIVTMLYERLSSFGHSSLTEKGRLMASISFLSENVLFSFLDSYLSRLEGPIAVQIWTSTLTFTRDILASTQAAKSQIFPILKCFTTFSEKISQTSALEDRRMRRDLQDTFVKLCDANIQGVGKYLEQSKGILESSDDVPSSAIEKDSLVSYIPPTSFHSDDKKTNELDKPLTGSQVIKFLTEKALPGCKRFLIEPDKLNAICANMMYYIVSPAFKARSRTFETDETLANLLVEMTKHSAASKAWRPQVIETFNDAKFFNFSPEVGRRWKPIIQALLNTDKERFIEMIGRISTAPSANIFTNKEAEMTMRSLSLRRITYAIYAADYNRFLVHLPSIQQKVVDLIRSNVGETVHAEVYLCMRVLLCRIANQHLSGFWPIILTELTRLFEGMIESVPETTNSLALSLSASKFLDLLLVLKTEDFQIHQWMFITDTVDAMYPPDSWFSHAIIDRLAEVMREKLGSRLNARRMSSPKDMRKELDPISVSVTPSLSRNGSALNTSVSRLTQDYEISLSLNAFAPKRRPLLLGTKKVDSIKPLERFFSRISLMNYEACYSGGTIDMEAVEIDLECDVFDDRVT